MISHENQFLVFLRVAVLHRFYCTIKLNLKMGVSVFMSMVEEGMSFKEKVS